LTPCKQAASAAGTAPPTLSMSVHAVTLVAFFAASSAPTPLYHLYQHAWGFTSAVLTVIFAVYALALLCALLTAGSLSDYTGRRPVIRLALLLEAAAMACLAAAQNPAWLIGARVIQGFATGLAAASIGSAMLDLDRQRGARINSFVPMSGTALGVLGSSLFVAYGHGPLSIVFVLWFALFLAALAATWLVPETGSRRPGARASLRPSISVPVQARAALWAATPANVAAWMLGGFYLSLMPSLIASTTHAASSWLGGACVIALTLCGALAALAGGRARAAPAVLAGAGAMALGLALVLVGANLGVYGWLLAGSLVAGLGFGASFMGAARLVLPLAEPQQRAGLMAAFYVESYLAHSLPAMAAGYMARHGGLLATANIYGAVNIALALAAIGLVMRRPARREPMR